MAAAPAAAPEGGGGEEKKEETAKEESEEESDDDMGMGEWVGQLVGQVELSGWERLWVWKIVVDGIRGTFVPYLLSFLWDETVADRRFSQFSHFYFVDLCPSNSLCH